MEKKELEDLTQQIFTHIKDPLASGKYHSICGQNIQAEFSFMCLDHVYGNAKAQGRLMPCLQCLKIVVDTITNHLTGDNKNENAN